VRILKDLDESIEGKDVVIVEDIVDSGLTLRYILGAMEMRRPASVRICGLLLKERTREIDVPIDYVGFRIPDRFVVGYGLDYAEAYRNLPYVGVLKPELYRDSEGAGLS
jgi:hypoxanthine phosphoribosyltransferase